MVPGQWAYISVGPAFVGAVSWVFDFLRALHADPVKVFSGDHPGGAHDACFLVVLDEHMVFLMETYGSPIVFKVDT